jgi:hypothetical protein
MAIKVIRTGLLPGALTVAAVLACACGGGGGGGGAAPPANLASAPGNAAITKFYTVASQVALAGTDTAGGTWTGSMTVAPNAGTTPFEGQVVDSDVITTTLTYGGTTQTGAQTSYYTLTPFRAVGSVLSTNVQYEVIGSWTSLPATISVGQSGTLGTSTMYHDITKSATDGTNLYTYSVSGLTPTALQLCLSDVFTATPGNVDGLVNLTQENCFSVDAAGTATVSQIVVTVNGTTVTLH